MTPDLLSAYLAPAPSTPLPPLPDLYTFTRSTHPLLATLAPELLGPRSDVALYDDSPYIAARPRAA